MSAQVKRTALVDRGHDPEIVREVTVADLSADPDGQFLKQVSAKLVLHRDQRLVWLRLPGASRNASRAACSEKPRRSGLVRTIGFA